MDGSRGTVYLWVEAWISNRCQDHAAAASGPHFEKHWRGGGQLEGWSAGRQGVSRGSPRSTRYSCASVSFSIKHGEQQDSPFSGWFPPQTFWSKYNCFRSLRFLSSGFHKGSGDFCHHPEVCAKGSTSSVGRVLRIVQPHLTVGTRRLNVHCSHSWEAAGKGVKPGLSFQLL